MIPGQGLWHCFNHMTWDIGYFTKNHRKFIGICGLEYSASNHRDIVWYIHVSKVSNNWCWQETRTCFEQQLRHTGDTFGHSISIEKHVKIGFLGLSMVSSWINVYYQIRVSTWLHDFVWDHFTAKKNGKCWFPHHMYMIYPWCSMFGLPRSKR